MIADCPETDIEFDALGLTSARKLRSAECYCSRATLDDLLSDEVMAPVLRSAGYEPDEFREMVTEMAWNLGHALIRAAWLVTSGLYRGIFLRAVRN